MKNILLYFLVFLITLPSLACAMPCASEKSSKHELTAMSGMTTISGMNGGIHEKHQSSLNMHEYAADNNAMLFLDCMDADFEQAQNELKVEDPSFRLLPIFDSILPGDLHITRQVLDVNIIRGPPLKSLHTGFSPPLFLVTQRVRL